MSANELHPPLRHLIYVEDEVDIRTVAQLALEAVGGFDVRLFGSGSELLEQAAFDTPQLILMDMMMPGLSGQETLEQLRARGITTPVIFMTAKTELGNTDAQRTQGVIGTIAKPFNPMTLAARVQELWDSYIQQRT